MGGWSKAFAEAGHECTGIDIKNIGYPYRFIKADLNDWIPDQKYDIVLASPPCTEFSIAKKVSNSQEDERVGLDLVYRTFYLINQLIKPKYFVIENVKGLGEFLPPPTEIIKYNRHKNGKAAYLWSNIGKLGFLETMITYRVQNKPTHQDTCKTKSDRAKIPYPLSLAVYKKIISL